MDANNSERMINVKTLVDLHLNLAMLGFERALVHEDCKHMRIDRRAFESAKAILAVAEWPEVRDAIAEAMRAAAERHFSKRPIGGKQ